MIEWFREEKPSHVPILDSQKPVPRLRQGLSLGSFASMGRRFPLCVAGHAPLGWEIGVCYTVCYNGQTVIQAVSRVSLAYLFATHSCTRIVCGP
jgi:hypothetical protein